MSHPIFEQFPLAEEPVATSTGPQATPYHVYDGHIALVGGSADLVAVEALLAPESVVPVAIVGGRTPMALWIADENDASHGAHGELQVSFYVTREPLAPIEDRPFALSRLLLEEPKARQMCHGLWNDSVEVVAYNREILGLDAQPADYRFERADGRLRFSFSYADGLEIARGDLEEGKRPTWAATRALFGTFGFSGAMRAARTKVVDIKVVNPIGEALPYNADARTLSHSDGMATHLFDPATEQLEILAAPYAGMDFRPTFVQHMRGFKMVYLEPERR